jgi:hypothetical protein
MRGFLRVLFAAPLAAALITSPSQGAQSAQSRTADEWYDQAVQATLDGDLEARQEALDAAIKVDPDHAPSRGERGEVKDGDRWVSAWYAQRLAAEDTDREAYQERVQGMDDTTAAHARMAKWCDNVGLSPEARAHWLKVLEANPKNADALAGIKATWRGDNLVDRDLAQEADEEDAVGQRAAQAWEKRLRKVELSRDVDAVETFQAEADRHATLPVERRIALLGSGDAKLDAKRREIAAAFIEASYGLPTADVTASLCRIATLATDKELAEQATEALKRRERFDVMPILLQNLRSPLEASHSAAALNTGGVVYGHRFYEQGREVDKEVTKRHAVHFSLAGINSIPDIDQRTDALIDARVRLMGSQLAFLKDSKTIDTQVKAYNQVVAKSNQRVFDSLEEVTEKDLGSHPRQWWDYWQRYSGYDVPYERPVTRQSNATQSLVTPPPPPPRCECFVAGTPVWTRDGKQAIETLKAGDLVMARDPHHGGIVYRVVIDTTVREPSSMVEVVAGGEKIHATVGHPFWVVGHGWKMAKELSEGDILSTIEGPVPVSSVNEYENAQAFNLVVEGAANYYVGENGVLVHDNTPRVPAVGLVARR